VGNARMIVVVALAAAMALHAQPKHISIERIALHQFEDGPALPATHEFLPGETVHFSCRLTGYQILKKDEEQSVKLAWQMRVLDPSGVPLTKDMSGHIEEPVLPQDKNWMPKFAAIFIIPGFAPTGAYRIPVKIKDEIDGAEVAAELTFQVRGHAVETSPTLVLRSFQFLRGEDDRVGLREPVYHPGEMLWARFDITGYKFGDNNRFSVDYGLAILRGTGEQLFSQPVAAEESKESFYPQRYVPGVLSLSLDQNVAKGSYILVITVRDKIGNQTGELRQPFQVS
jgi:hypothetical protein